MHYISPQIITSKSGNNSLSYDERMRRSATSHIVIPSIQKITTVSEIQLSLDVRIEEIDAQGVLHSESGLAHIYELGKCHIFDNHNHALYFRIQYMNSQTEVLPVTPAKAGEGVTSSKINVGGLSLIHIDQHSDLNTPKKSILDYLQPPTANKQSEGPPVKGVDAGKAASGGLDLDLLRRYTNFECQISNFIKPFLSLYPKTDFNRIKSESQLLESQFSSLKSQIFVLDIDLDFRAPEMNIEKFTETIRITRQLIAKADSVTIASSPLFIDQQKSIDLLHALLT